ncbi:MAG: single-stranded DNA-binding protein [Candidatus Pacearchaeota archaeon]
MLNKIMLIGNLGRDIESRFTTSNVTISNFSLATTHNYKGKDGNWVNETTWHNITSFNLSDYLKEHLKKGSKVYVEGRISKREYTDKEGTKRYSVDVISEVIRLLDKTEVSSTFETTEDKEIKLPDNNDDLPF